jgi:transposase
MSKKKRRSFTASQKATILRRHLSDKVPVSDLCEEYKLQPSVFYGWQRQLLENLESAVEPGTGRRAASAREAALTRKIEALEARLAKKDGVIAEISEEYVTLKKELGEL